MPHCHNSRSTSLQHDQCSSGLLRATHTIHMTHAINKKNQQSIKNEAEIAIKYDIVYRRTKKLLNFILRLASLLLKEPLNGDQMLQVVCQPSTSFFFIFVTSFKKIHNCLHKHYW